MTARLPLYCLLTLIFFIPQKLHSQWGYSSRIDSLVNLVTDSTVSLLVRELSGDTTIMLGGSVDSIMSRHSYHSDNPKAAQFILEKFQSYGLDARIQDYDANGQNVIATLEGDVYPNKQYIICGHYDSQPSGSLAPGADDNASGTVGVLEAARVLSNESCDYTIKFIAFDEEEQGLIGSKAYADSAFALGHDIQAVINLDMIAWDSNNDGELSLASNFGSMGLFSDYIEIIRLYEPGLSPHLIYITASDHASFWNKGWDALLAIEEYPFDFNSYYHTTSDLFQYLNIDYFAQMARGAISVLATLAYEYEMELQHDPVASSIYTESLAVPLVAGSGYPVAAGENGPKLWYRLDGGDFYSLPAVNTMADTFYFDFPVFSPGQKIEYYFAVQESNGEFVSTLPPGGRGVSPPGSEPGGDYYSFYVLNDTTSQFAHQSLPQSIPTNITSLYPIDIPVTARIHDINVTLSIGHTYPRYLKIFLVHPDGTQIELSTGNGFNYDNYTSTVFDDEASEFIHQDQSPFSGAYRPEEPLATFDERNLYGEWKLKIHNSSSYSGTLSGFSIQATYTDKYYFVDSAVAQSGHGMSWDSAFNKISEAFDRIPGPGNRVFIKPGTYHEDLEVRSNGEVVVPVATGVSVHEGDTVKFTSPADLSGIELEYNPGEYYVLVYRSSYSNNGCFRVKEVDDANGFLIAGGADFVGETGLIGDTNSLSAAVIRPVVYERSPGHDGSDRVVVDALQSDTIFTIFYIGDPIGDGSTDAWPADANLIRGIDFTNSAEGSGIHLQSSSFNVISGGRIYETNGAGIYINGNEERPSKYNIICENEIFNTPFEGIYVGAGGMPPSNNHAHFTHIIDNEIYTVDGSSLAQIENAIDLKEYNYGTVVDGNLLRDIDLVTAGNGAIDIRKGQQNALVYGNTFHNIGVIHSGTGAVIQVYADNQSVAIFNNVIYRSAPEEDGLYAFRLDGTSHTNSAVFHNTVFNLNNGLLLEDYGADPDFTVSNNIISINNEFFTNWGTGGRFEVSHNLFTEDPTPESWMHYYGSPGRQVGDPGFADTLTGDLNITIFSDKAINKGLIMGDFQLYDRAGNERYMQGPDLGAFELGGKLVWTGALDTDWFTPGNWSANSVPDTNSNVVIQPAANSPLLQGQNTEVSGVIILEGAGLTIGAALETR